jgi:hypothetical protein
MALSIAIASTAVSAYSSYEATQQGKKGVEAQKRTQELETRRARYAARNEARRARAAAVAGGEAAGASAGSGVFGAVGSITSQGAAGQTYLGQSEQLSNDYYNAKMQETIFSGYANTFGKIADLGFGFATDFGIFKPKPGQATTGANTKPVAG